MDLTTCLDPVPPSPEPLRFLAEGVYTFDHALSEVECAALVAAAEAVGFEDAPIPIGPGRFLMAPRVRNNTRVMIDDPGLASALWARLAPVLPPAPPLGGPWRASGLNERFRLYRYEVGQAFRWHRDGAYRREREESF